MYKLGIAALITATSLVAVPALAADLYIPPAAQPAFVATSDWTGPYIGAFIGGHFGTVIEYQCTGLCSGNFALNGVAGGLEAGYDAQIEQQWVLGVFGQLPLLRPTGSVTLGGAGGPVFTVTPQWAVLGGARLGYDMGNLLPYAFVGGALENDTVSTSFGASSNATHTGVIAGAGLEYKFDRNWSVDARYTYMTLGSAAYNFGGGADAYGENSHNLTLAVHYRF